MLLLLLLLFVFFLFSVSLLVPEVQLRLTSIVVVDFFFLPSLIPFHSSLQHPFILPLSLSLILHPPILTKSLLTHSSHLSLGLSTFLSTFTIQTCFSFLVDFVQAAAATVTGGATAAGTIAPNGTCTSDNCTQNATVHTLLNNITETGGCPGRFLNGIKGIFMKGAQRDL